MNRFNLTFSGEIQTGLQPEDVKLRFAKKFAIDDTERLERFFSGKTITLRRNLDRKDAAQCFQEMQQIGVVAQLVKMTAEEAAAQATFQATPSSTENTSESDKDKGGILGLSKRAQRKADKKSKKDTSGKKAAKADQRANGKAGAKDSIPKKIAAAADSLPTTQEKQVLKEQQAAAEAAERARRLAEEETAALRTEREAQREETDRLKTLQAEAQAQHREEQQAAEKAEEARQQAEQETAQLREERALEAQQQERSEAQVQAKKEAEAKTLQQAEREQQALIAQEQQAQRQREQLEKKRLQTEQTARRKAEKARAKAEKEKKQAQRALAKAQQQAKQKLEAEEQKHLAAVKAVQQEAKRQEQLRLEAEAQALATAEQDRQNTQLAEQAKREAEQAAAEEARQVAQAKAASRQAEVEKERAAKADQKIENARQEALAEAARQAELDRLELEKAAQKRAQEEQHRALVDRELAEKARQKTEKLMQRNAQLEKESALATEKTARLEAELAIQQRRETERLAQEKIAQQETRQRQEEERRQEEQRATEQHLRLEAENAAASAALEEGPVKRAASELAASTSLKPARASVRTSLDVPQRSTGASSTPKRKRQQGEPNLYSLRPFRNTPAVRHRATQARKAAGRYGIAGAIALAALLALCGAYLRYTPPTAIAGTSALATSANGDLLLITRDTLFIHDRSGTATGSVEIAALGLTRVTRPLAYEKKGTLLLTGQIAGSSVDQLLRCELETKVCSPLPELPDDVRVSTFAIAPLSGQLLLLDAAAGELLNTDADGRILARANVPIPLQPHVAIDSGLLMLNSDQAPAISVLRYDKSAFGQQLDEVLLLPPVAAKAGHNRVADFVYASGSWWVTLFNPDSGSAAVYRFDGQWNYLDQASLNTASTKLQLASWGDKALINDPDTPEVLRFNSEGLPEVSLRSEQLEEYIKQSQRRGQLTATGWRLAIFGCALLAALGLGAAYHQRLRRIVYKAGRERGADPIDDYTDNIQWIEHFPKRQTAMRARGISYCVLSLALVLLAMGQQASAIEVGALLLLLAGPAVALLLYARNSPGYLGVLDEQLILVESAGIYHMGSDADILFRGGFLFIDDVALFMGNKLLPAFSTSQLTEQILPLVRGGVRVDRKTLIVRLLQSGHPLAHGALATMACSLAALSLLLIPRFF